MASNGFESLNKTAPAKFQVRQILRRAPTVALSFVSTSEDWEGLLQDALVCAFLQPSTCSLSTSCSNLSLAHRWWPSCPQLCQSEHKSGSNLQVRRQEQQQQQHHCELLKTWPNMLKWAWISKIRHRDCYLHQQKTQQLEMVPLEIETFCKCLQMFLLSEQDLACKRWWALSMPRAVAHWTWDTICSKLANSDPRLGNAGQAAERLQ